MNFYPPFVLTILDQVGVVNVDLKCTDNENLPHWYVATVTNWGSWDKWRKCGKNQAICGIQTLVKKDDSSNESALNDMNLFCCDIV